MELEGVCGFFSRSAFAEQSLGATHACANISSCGRGGEEAHPGESGCSRCSVTPQPEQCVGICTSASYPARLLLLLLLSAWVSSSEEAAMAGALRACHRDAAAAPGGRPAAL